MKICTFLWTYYGYPNACYEGVNVEMMRTRNGEIMAETDIKNGKLPEVDYVVRCAGPAFRTPSAMQTAAAFRLQDRLLSIRQLGREALCQPARPCGIKLQK